MDSACDGNLGEDSRKQRFGLDRVLSESRNQPVIRCAKIFYLEGRRNGAW